MSYRLPGPQGYKNFPHLTAMYYDFQFNDASTRSIAFYNGLSYMVELKEGLVTTQDTTNQFFQTEQIAYDASAGLSVQALIKINGVWQVEDWTSSPYEVFCRDVKAERIEQLVLIISNSNWNEDQQGYEYIPFGEQPTLVLSPVGCWRWKGTYKYTGQYDNGTNTTTGSVTFERTAPFISPVQYYHIVDGNAQVSIQSKSPDPGITDTYNANGTVIFQSNEGGDQSWLVTYNFVIAGPSPNSYYGVGVSSQEINPCGTHVYDAEEGTITEPFCPSPGYFFLTPPGYDSAVKQLTNWTNMSGTNNTGWNDLDKYEWSFEALIEP